MAVREKIEAGFERFARLIVRFRWLAIALLLGISIALGLQLQHLRVDNSDEALLRRDDPARIGYDRFKERFGKDERVHIVLRPPEIFDLAFLDQLRRIHRDIEREVPYVADVTSLINARNTRGEGDSLIVEDLTEDWPENEQDLATLRARVFDNPLFINTLIAWNESLTVIAIRPFTFSTLTPEVDELAGFDDAEGAADAMPIDLSDGEYAELIAGVREIVARHSDASDEIWITGGPIIDEWLNTIMSRDIARSFSISIALILGILLLLFRRISGALLPLFVVVASLVATFGVMAIVGIPFSMTLNLLPALLLTVGICDSIHILAIFYQRLAAGDSREDAIAFALGHSGLAVLMTSLTTAAGLASFATAELTGVGHLGVVAPAGVLSAMVYSLVLLPALLAVLPISARAVQRGRLEGFLVDSVLMPMGRLAISRPRPVLAVTALLVLIALFGVARLRFSHDGIRWFPERDPVRYSAELIDQEFRGTSSLEVVVDTGRENGLHDPDTLARIERAMRWSETLSVEGYPVDKAISIVDIVKEIHRALNGGASEAYVLPEDRQLIAQELLLFENSGTDDLEDWTDSQFQTARISIRTPWVDALSYPEFVRQAADGFREILGEDLEFELTGGARVFSGLFGAVVMSMTRSYVIALVVITPLLILLIGNLRRGLLAMIPNLIPIVFTLALMGWSGIPIDLSTLLIGGVLLGVAVDDTIHFMHKFNRYYARSGDASEAAEQTLATTGTALLFTSLVLIVGFSVFVTSYLVNIAWFGLLAASAAAIAFLADVVVAPALMVVATRDEREARG